MCYTITATLACTFHHERMQRYLAAQAEDYALNFNIFD